MKSKILQPITDLLISHGYRDPENNMEVILIYLEGILKVKEKAQIAMDFSYQMKRNLDFGDPEPSYNPEDNT